MKRMRAVAIAVAGFVCLSGSSGATGGHAAPTTSKAVDSKEFIEATLNLTPLRAGAAVLDYGSADDYFATLLYNGQPAVYYGSPGMDPTFASGEFGAAPEEALVVIASQSEVYLIMATCA